jgi:predicted 3-demethylubiquinone-9 3-methyltransferase (glyoxalase superfamily)
MQRITPCLWFDNQAEEAVDFYVSVFRNAKKGKVARYGKSSANVSGRPEGSVLTVAFELNGQHFLAMNGGPMYKFSPATSMMVVCDTQEEIDHYWDRLSEGGKPSQCGWLDDKYGVTWQIVPSMLEGMAADPDPSKSERMMKALLKMIKLDMAELKRAYDSP